MEWLLSYLFGRPDYCVVDYGSGAIFVLRSAEAAGVVQGKIVRDRLRFRKAQRVASKLRQAWRETPRPIL